MEKKEETIKKNQQMEQRCCPYEQNQCILVGNCKEAIFYDVEETAIIDRRVLKCMLVQGYTTQVLQDIAELFKWQKSTKCDKGLLHKHFEARYITRPHAFEMQDERQNNCGKNQYEVENHIGTYKSTTFLHL